MAIEKLHIEKFLELAKLYPVLDARSPGEYLHAHIPAAASLPLFTDEERKVVGTAYKLESREMAIKIGLDYFGPKMRKMVEAVEMLTAGQTQATINAQETFGKTVLVHCWRGGMRSAAIAWLLDLYGFKVYTLAGGYKKFRQYVLDSFAKDYPFYILGGYTGSAKTELLQELRNNKHTIVDLECLAAHKGSAFGSLGMPAQPSQEMFENLLAMELRQATNQHPIWLEDESQRIGEVNIPTQLWNSMRKAPVFFIDIPFEERLQFINKWYGKQNREKIINAIIRIKKRLGGLETKTALNFLIEDNTVESFRVLLTYYDKWYLKGLNNRESPLANHYVIPCCNTDAGSNVATLLKYIENIAIK
jgi:tRNA 2-selenouridine synthase